MRFYDWRKTLTQINGVPATNFAPGDDAFKAERLQDLGTLEIGADGLGVFSLNPDKSGQVTVKFMQTSPTNGYLSKLCQAMDYLDTFIPVVVTHVDTYRQDKLVTLPGVIKKPADLLRGVKQNHTEWVFLFPSLFMDLGDPAFTGLPTAVAEALG